MAEKNYESTVMRIAGNLLSGEPKLMVNDAHGQLVPNPRIIMGAVACARAIVAETLRSQPSHGERGDPVAPGK